MRADPRSRSSDSSMSYFLRIDALDSLYLSMQPDRYFLMPINVIFVENLAATICNFIMTVDRHCHEEQLLGSEHNQLSKIMAQYFTTRKSKIYKNEYQCRVYSS